MPNIRTHLRGVARLLTVGAASIAFAAGCSCGTEEAVEMPAKTAQETEKAPPRPQQPAPLVKPEAPRSVAEQLARKVDIPSFYPADGPVYPDTQPSDVKRQAGKVTAIFSSDDSLDQVKAWANEELASNGWESIEEQAFQTSTMLRAFKGRRLVSVLVSPIDSGGEEVTLIAISVDP